MKKRLISITLVIILILSGSMAVFADCSSIAVGKDASLTGNILLGHNEDNGGRLVMPAYWFERNTHEPGEYIEFGDSEAKIPEVEQTWAYGWSETRSESGASFSDGYINEWGVAIVSNNCRASKEENPELVNGGIGYGLRTLMAQRAKSAREAVEIGADLLDTWGYNYSGRTYVIADQNEAWLLEVVYGKQYVAQRVPDNEIAFIPNHYTIRQVDMNDSENFIASDDLITYAIEQGWYKPVKEDDYSDFDFAKVYQAEESWRTAGNLDRHYNALRLFQGKKWSQRDKDKEMPFSIKLDRKIGVDDVKEVLRSHYEGTPDDKSNDFEVDPHFDGVRRICTSSTQESAVFEFNEILELTTYWRSITNPCTGLYQPWYILASESVPEGYGWIDPLVGLANHFKVPASDLAYNQDRAWWAFYDLQYLARPQYGDVIDEIQDELFELEGYWEEIQPIIETIATMAYKNGDTRLARDLLTEYTNSQAKKAWALVKDLYERFDTTEIEILANRLSKSSQAETSIVIYTNDYLDAKDVDVASIISGPGCQSPSRYVAPTKVERKDINKDGKLDLLLTFDNQELLKYAYPTYCDIWLTGKTKAGDVFVAKDIVNIKE